MKSSAFCSGRTLKAIGGFFSTEREKAVSELKRAEGMLANPNFVNRAPAAKVEAEKEKVVKYRAMLQEIDSQLQAFA